MMFTLEKWLAISSGLAEMTRKVVEIFRNLRAPILIALLGIIGIFSSIFILLADPYTFLFQMKCVLSDGGEIYDLWKSPPVDLYLRVYLWNITNKDEFLSGQDDKLKVVEVGPYVYKEMFLHEDVVFNDNGTVSAIPRHPLIWVPELSEGRKEDDLLILPNIALLSIAHVVSDESYFTRVGLNLLIRQTKTEPLVQMTAKEFMFGYKSTLVTLGNKLLPNWIYFDKLGLIDRMYDFEGDYETVFTGETDVRLSGLIDTYRGAHKIPQWENPCGNIHMASDGTKFPGYIQPNDTLLFFRKSMCRAKQLVKVNETVASGLRVYTYNFREDADDNGATNPENKCFCAKGKCLPAGLLDVHGCYYGFPIALSYPHFMGSDPVVKAKVVGMNPEPEKHKSYFKIQPESGLPVEVAVRYQINMALGSIKTIANTERFNNMILPLLWTEIRLYSLPDVLAARFRLYLNVLPVVTDMLMYFFFAVGILFLLFSLYRFVKTKRSREVYKSSWIEDDFVLNMERKISSYKPEKRASMNSKELEVYFNSLVAPLNQELMSYEEFQELREEDV